MQGRSCAAEDAAEKVFISPDRATLKKLAESRKLLAEGRFGEAVRNLDAILEGPEDYFFEPDKNSGKSRGSEGGSAAIDRPDAARGARTVRIAVWRAGPGRC